MSGVNNTEGANGKLVNDFQIFIMNLIWRLVLGASHIAQKKEEF